MNVSDVMPTNILVIADSNWVNLCDDADAYLLKLRAKLGDRRENGVSFMTVPGKYGLSQLDTEMPVLEVDDKNKTQFVQTLENANLMFDELVIISIADGDTFINGAKEVVTGLTKSFTHYRYKRK